jgi:hypothetical protein
MERAFFDASGREGSGLTANARQIMYAARPEIQQRSGKKLDDNYFTQTLLPDYIADRDPPWKSKVVYDDRGHLIEPHTGKTIGLGTLAVRNYLAAMRDPKMQIGLDVGVKTLGPSLRFGHAFFIEKEGFDAHIQEAQLAERFDLAFMSCKGISVTAARELADEMCHAYDIPLYLLTDFDKSGFTGAATFERSNRRYTYQNEIEVVRIGLRLPDVQRIANARGVPLDHFTEEVFDRGKEETRRENLLRNGTTAEEADFLLRRRVELNALRTNELIAFIERKLNEHGVRKVVPERSILDEAYRLFKRGDAINLMIVAELAKPDDIQVPTDLEHQVRACLSTHPECPWDAAVARIAGWTDCGR